MYFYYDNREVKLRLQIEAQQKANESTFDNFWKEVQQKAKVATEYRDSFREIFDTLMSRRYPPGGDPLVKFIQEHNPDYEPSVLKSVQETISAGRLNWNREQHKLIDLQREHDTLKQTIPGRWFVGKRPGITITVITSSDTETDFISGKEEKDRLDPFG
jgi:hypothetical protein